VAGAVVAGATVAEAERVGAAFDGAGPMQPEVRSTVASASPAQTGRADTGGGVGMTRINARREGRMPVSDRVPRLLAAVASKR
jgi:hypothetical protein